MPKQIIVVTPVPKPERKGITKPDAVSSRTRAAHARAKALGARAKSVEFHRLPSNSF